MRLAGHSPVPPWGCPSQGMPRQSSTRMQMKGCATCTLDHSPSSPCPTLARQSLRASGAAPQCRCSRTCTCP
eukprot:scaffold274_cov384-Prasinococcus_capsulatus_cf.AAC.6